MHYAALRLAQDDTLIVWEWVGYIEADPRGLCSYTCLHHGIDLRSLTQERFYLALTCSDYTQQYLLKV